MAFQEGYIIAYTLKVTIYCQKHDNITISREEKHLIFEKIRRLSKFCLGRIFTSLGIFGLFLQNIYPCNQRTFIHIFLTKAVIFLDIL